MSQVRVHTLAIVTKDGENRMQHVWDIGMLTEEEEEEKKKVKKKRRRRRKKKKKKEEEEELEPCVVETTWTLPAFEVSQVTPGWPLTPQHM